VETVHTAYFKTTILHHRCTNYIALLMSSKTKELKAFN